MGQRAASASIYYLVAAEGHDTSPDAIMFGALIKKAGAASRVVDGVGAPANDLRDVAVLTPTRHSASRPPENDSTSAHEGASASRDGTARDPKTLPTGRDGVSDGPGVISDVAETARPDKRRRKLAADATTLSSARGTPAVGSSSGSADAPVVLSDSDDECNVRPPLAGQASKFAAAVAASSRGQASSRSRYFEAAGAAANAGVSVETAIDVDDDDLDDID